TLDISWLSILRMVFGTKRRRRGTRAPAFLPPDVRHRLPPVAFSLTPCLRREALPVLVLQAWSSWRPGDRATLPSWKLTRRLAAPHVGHSPRSPPASSCSVHRFALRRYGALPLRLRNPVRSRCIEFATGLYPLSRACFPGDRSQLRLAR